MGLRLEKQPSGQLSPLQKRELWPGSCSGSITSVSAGEGVGREQGISDHVQEVSAMEESSDQHEGVESRIQPSVGRGC